jgi:hypothetical protein
MYSDHMKNLLTLTAVIESITGLLLVLLPSKLVSFLFGSALDSPVALMVAHIAGVALMALGITCWIARNDNQSSAVKGVIIGLIVYNAGVFAVLAYAKIGLGLSGIGLWPAVLVHFIMTIWCVLSLLDLSRRAKGT